MYSPVRRQAFLLGIALPILVLLAALAVGSIPRAARAGTRPINPAPALGTGWEPAAPAARARPAWAAGPLSGPARRAVSGPATCAALAQVPSPNPDAAGDILDGVTALTATDAWAVGFADPGVPSDTDQSVIVHWDGMAWSVVPGAVAGLGRTQLKAVAAVAPTDIWAVGSTDQPGGGQTFAEHWDGAQWTAVPTPSVAGFPNVLSGIGVVAANDIWAVGAYATAPGFNGWRQIVEHWDGAHWMLVPVPAPGPDESGLSAVAVLAANDIWAAGWAGAAPAYHGLTEHWNGSQWTAVPAADLGTDGHVFSGIAAVGPADVWAVGERGGNTPLAEHWDGTAWHVVPAAPDTQGVFQAVAVVSGAVWAAGTSTSPPGALIERWTGSVWQVVPGALAGPQAALYALAAGPSGEVWAVGYAAGTGQPEQTLIEHAAAACAPTPTPGSTPAPTPCPISFRDVSPADYFYGPVLYLACRGVISGYADGTFRPYAATTRGQLAKIVAGAEGWPLTTAGGPHFTDVSPAHPFYAFVETAYAHGAVSGYGDGTFRPSAGVTRGQLAKIVVRAQGWAIQTPPVPDFRDVPAGSPFYGVIETAYAHGIIAGYAGGTFRPGAAATRGQIAKIVYGAVTAP